MTGIKNLHGAVLLKANFIVKKVLCEPSGSSCRYKLLSQLMQPMRRINQCIQHAEKMFGVKFRLS